MTKTLDLISLPIHTRRANCKNGFTLVELLVVIAIIAILGVVAIAAINPVAKINSAKDNQALANVQQISKAFEACLADKMTSGTAGAAYNTCCGSNGTNGAAAADAAGACVSNTTQGLGLPANGYGFSSGWPTGVIVNRSALAAGAATVCVNQPRGSDTNYFKYVTGGGTVTNVVAASLCTAGI